MIVLGVCPGLNSLAYAVLDVKRPEPGGVLPLDVDILHARPLSAETAHNLPKRCRVHHLVLGVVAERYAPEILAVGPAAEPAEEPHHVEAMAEVLTAMAVGIGIPSERIAEKSTIVKALRTTDGNYGKAVHSYFSGPLGSRDRRIILAAATAIAAVRFM